MDGMRSKDLLGRRWERPLVQETHRRIIDGPIGDCWEALLDVTVAELPMYRVLMTLRSAGRWQLEPAASALESMPPKILATDPPFHLLSELSWPRPRVDIGMDFRLEPQGRRTFVTTRTRVWAADLMAATLFLPYWMFIRPGSGLIRRELLNAIARRVEVV